MTDPGADTRHRGILQAILPRARPEGWRTIPNYLTLTRIAAVPCFVGTWYFELPITAAAIFGAAAVTDIVDGRLARRWNQRTSLGALLDPLADKMLVAAALLILVEHSAHASVTIPAVAILCRELSVSSIREWAQQKLPESATGMAVAWHGKLKAVLQMVSLQLLLLGVACRSRIPDGADAVRVNAGYVNLRNAFEGGGQCLLWAAAFVTLASGAAYFRFALLISRNEPPVSRGRPTKT